MAAAMGAYGMPTPAGGCGGCPAEPSTAYRYSSGVGPMPTGIATGPSFDARGYGGDGYQTQQMGMMQQMHPQQMQAGPGGPCNNSPYGPPMKLTQGLPDPASVERQKEGYMRSLEEQEQKSNASLDMQRKQQLELIHAGAEQQKKKLFMQIDQQVKTQEMALTQQYNQQLLQLNQQYHQQKAALEQQAMQLTMEYQQQRMQEEMAKKQMELQREHHEVQARFHADLQKLHGNSNGPEMSGMPPGAVTQGQPGASYVPPPMASGSYVPPPMQGSYGSSGSYVPPPMPGGATGSYVPPAASIGSIGGGGSYVPPGQAPCGSIGSYVPPAGAPMTSYSEAVAAGSMPSACNGVMQPNVPTYGPSAASNYMAPPTSYGPVPASHSYGSMNSLQGGAPAPSPQYSQCPAS